MVKSDCLWVPLLYLALLFSKIQMSEDQPANFDSAKRNRNSRDQDHPLRSTLLDSRRKIWTEKFEKESLCIWMTTGHQQSRKAFRCERKKIPWKKQSENPFGERETSSRRDGGERQVCEDAMKPAREERKRGRSDVGERELEKEEREKGEGEREEREEEEEERVEEEEEEREEEEGEEREDERMWVRFVGVSARTLVDVSVRFRFCSQSFASRMCHIFG
jgi:hypothetical protein